MRKETDKEAILGMVSELYQRIVESNNIKSATLDEIPFYEDVCASVITFSGMKSYPKTGGSRSITLTVRMK